MNPVQPWLASTSTLRGVGEGTQAALMRLLPRMAGDDAPRLRDLLFHLPVSCLDRRFSPALYEAPDGAMITAVVTVDRHQPPVSRSGKPLKKAPYRVLCSNETGTLTLVLFHARGGWAQQALPVGQKRVVSGKVERFDGMLQMVHPDIIAPVADLTKVQGVEAVYPLTYALTNRALRRLVEQALDKMPPLPEWLDATMLQQRQWPAFREAIIAVHHPHVADDIAPHHIARQRLAYDELLASQLALALVRRHAKRQPSTPLPPAPQLREKLEAALPFTLTPGQAQALTEMEHDMASGERMIRLLQGDVGSGKTVVALLAALPAIAAGGQVAIMVPTEIVARQHFAFIERLASEIAVRVAFLTGNTKGDARRTALENIASGDAQIIIGTHALFQDGVSFHALHLVVMDEQHRFGVEQRMALSAKGTHPHVLLMTATPIPRSLAMTAFGDMDSSVLPEKPPGRKPIDTRAIPLSRVDDVMAGVKRAVEQGGRVYWICPLIEESEEEKTSELAAVEARFRELRAMLGSRAAMLHGRMRAEEKDATMAAFASGAVQVLVATTVVEVGVNVPEATIMVIEQAERFGLAQLHQLRGRVGRGENPSTCLLLYQDRIGETARARLKILRESEDGFRIAEEDLKLRGSGEILGTRQSGMPDFRFVDFAAHADLITTARDDAKYILQQDPHLTTSRGLALRDLLTLFGHPESARFLGAG